MKRAFGLLLCLAAGVASVAQEDSIKTVIRGMDQKNAAVIVKPDSAALRDLLAPDFTINRSTGAVVSGWLNTLELFQKGIVRYDSFVVQTEMVLVKSPSLAISMGSEVVVMGGNHALKGQSIKRRFTHIWTKEKDTWKLLARHANNSCTP